LRVKIAARHCTISDALRERAENKMQRLTRYHPRVTGADVVFSETKRLRHVEVILSVDRGEPIVARAEDENFRSALDKVVDRLSRMVRKAREAGKDHQAPPLSSGVISSAIE
jgi:putative sigma-54 modulation protein